MTTMAFVRDITMTALADKRDAAPAGSNLRNLTDADLAVVVGCVVGALGGEELVKLLEIVHGVAGKRVQR